MGVFGTVELTFLKTVPHLSTLRLDWPFLNSGPGRWTGESTNGEGHSRHKSEGADEERQEHQQWRGMRKDEHDCAQEGNAKEDHSSHEINLSDQKDRTIRIAFLKGLELRKMSLAAK